MPFGERSQYLAYFKGYLSRLIEKVIRPRFSGDEKAILEWKKKIQDVFNKEVLQKDFDEFQFYSGSSMDPDGIIVLAIYENGAQNPTFLVWKDGLKEEKY
jgi:hypothetical protein